MRLIHFTDVNSNPRKLEKGSLFSQQEEAEPGLQFGFIQVTSLATILNMVTPKVQTAWFKKILLLAKGLSDVFIAIVMVFIHNKWLHGKPKLLLKMVKL